MITFLLYIHICCNVYFVYVYFFYTSPTRKTLGVIAIIPSSSEKRFIFVARMLKFPHVLVVL